MNRNTLKYCTVLLALVLIFGCDVGFEPLREMHITSIPEEGGTARLEDELTVEFSEKSFEYGAEITLEEVALKDIKKDIPENFESLGPIYHISSDKTLTESGAQITIKAEGVTEDDITHNRLFVLHIHHHEIERIPAEYDADTQSVTVMTDRFSLFGLFRNKSDSPESRGENAITMNKLYTINDSTLNSGDFSVYDESYGLLDPKDTWGVVDDPTNTTFEHNKVLFCSAESSELDEQRTSGYPKNVDAGLEFFLPQIDNIKDMKISFKAMVTTDDEDTARHKRDGLRFLMRGGVGMPKWILLEPVNVDFSGYEGGWIFDTGGSYQTLTYDVKAHYEADDMVDFLHENKTVFRILFTSDGDEDVTGTNMGAYIDDIKVSVETDNIAPPTGFEASSFGTNYIRYSWDDNNADEDGYVINVDGQQYSTEANATSLWVDNLSCGTTYTATIQTIKFTPTGLQYSPISTDEVTVTTEECTYDTPDDSSDSGTSDSDTSDSGDSTDDSSDSGDTSDSGDSTDDSSGEIGRAHV